MSNPTLTSGAQRHAELIGAGQKDGDGDEEDCVAVVHAIIAASAARTERDFSWAGIGATARRNGLQPEALEWLVLMKRNQDFLPTSEEMAEEYMKQYHHK